MEYMSLAMLVQYGTPVILFALIVLNVYQSFMIHQMRKELNNVKENITWGDTCGERHDEIGRRLRTLERKTGLNGAAV